MMGKYIALAVTAMLAVACVASPLYEEVTQPTPQAPEARVKRAVPLPEDQREFISRQILQALSGAFLDAANNTVGNTLCI